MRPLKTVVRTVKSMHFLTYTFYPQNIFFVNSIILYSIFFTELHKATSSRKDGSSNSLIWLSWVETLGYEVCDKFHCWRRLFDLITYSTISALSPLRHRSPLVSAGAKSDANHHSADPLHPKKSLWASASPVRRREPCNLIETLKSPFYLRSVQLIVKRHLARRFEKKLNVQM